MSELLTDCCCYDKQSKTWLDNIPAVGNTRIKTLWLSPTSVSSFHLAHIRDVLKSTVGSFEHASLCILSFHSVTSSHMMTMSDTNLQ